MKIISTYLNWIMSFILRHTVISAYYCMEYIVTICQFVELIQIDWHRSRMKYKMLFRSLTFWLRIKSIRICIKRLIENVFVHNFFFWVISRKGKKCNCIIGMTEKENLSIVLISFFMIRYFINYLTKYLYCSSNTWMNKIFRYIISYVKMNIKVWYRLVFLHILVQILKWQI